MNLGHFTGSYVREADIRVRAYQLFLQRAGSCGDALSDWLRAEKELHAALGTPSSPDRLEPPARRENLGQPWVART